MSRLFRRYGSNYQTVTLEFEAKALNEVGFRRDHEHTIPTEELEERFELTETLELTSEARGEVQNETEHQRRDRLQAKVMEALARLPDGGIAVIENERSGRDQPKPRQKIGTVVERGENRLAFEYTIDPPLRVSLYAPRG